MCVKFEIHDEIIDIMFMCTKFDEGSAHYMTVFYNPKIMCTKFVQFRGLETPIDAREDGSWVLSVYCFCFQLC